MDTQTNMNGGFTSKSTLQAPIEAEMISTSTVVELQQKYPISQTLRQLNIGESVSFPCEQRASLLAIANRIKKELARHGWDYTYEDDSERFIVIFTRIQ